MYNTEEIDERVHRLRELERQIADLSTEAENIKNDLKSLMTEKGVEELKGEDWLVTWKTVTSSRFDQSGFKAIHPDLFESFKVASSSRRFSLK